MADLYKDFKTQSENCVDSSASENLCFATLFWDIFSRGKSYKNISEWLCNL